jgi:putative MFS transporter
MEVLLLSFLSVVLTIEWGLEGHENELLISVVFMGALFGTLILSPLGDRLGRRPIFSLTAAIIAIFGVGTAFCKSYEALLFVRFMVGFGVGGLVVPFDTLAEFLPADYRGSNLLVRIAVGWPVVFIYFVPALTVATLLISGNPLLTVY